MADQRLRTPKMPMEEEANAYSQPDKGLLSLQKRRQVAHRQPEEAPQGRQSPASSLHGDRLPRLPCPESSQATGSRRVQSDSVARSKALPCNRVVLQEDHQPRQAATAGHAPTAWPSECASTCCKLPPLPPASSASPAVGWETASSTEASSCLQPVPPARGINGERGRPARVRSYRPARQLPPAYSAAVKDTAWDITNKVLCKVFTASHGPSQQPAAPWDRAHRRAAAVTETTDKVLAADSSTAPAAWPTLRGARGATGAASRAPAPASLDRDAGPGHQGPAAQQDPPASPVLSEQAPAAEAEGQAPAPYTPPDYEDEALQDTTVSIVGEVLINSVLVNQHKEAQSMDVATAASPPAVPEDTESALSASHEEGQTPAPYTPPDYKEEALQDVTLSIEEGQTPAPYTPPDYEDEALQDVTLSIVGEVLINSLLVNQHKEEGQTPAPYTPPDYEDEALQDVTLSIVGEVLINSLLVNQHKLRVAGVLDLEGTGETLGLGRASAGSLYRPALPQKKRGRQVRAGGVPVPGSTTPLPLGMRGRSQPRRRAGPTSTARCPRRLGKGEPRGAALRQLQPGPERVEGPARGPGSAPQPARHQAAQHGGDRPTTSAASLLQSRSESRLPEMKRPGPPSDFASAGAGAGGCQKTTTPVVQCAPKGQTERGAGAGADGRCSSRRVNQ
ncbi:uncharacterized protein FN964_014937 [Alca torda]